MSNKYKLKRITDLFSQGEVAFLGDDENAKPICLWINKPNSIEEEESRLDAQSARTECLLAMTNINHPDIVNAHMQIEELSDEELFSAVVDQNSDQMIGLSTLDLEGDKEWEDKIEYLRRHEHLLNDADVAEDDPRRKQMDEYNREYIDRVEELYNKRRADMLEEMKSKGREDVEKQFMKDLKDRISLDYYMLEKRITQLYYATRDCEATRDKDGNFEHSKCDHSKRLFESRKEVREAPEDVLNKINSTLDSVLVGGKNLANFPETQSSSESSALPNGAEV